MATKNRQQLLLVLTIAAVAVFACDKLVRAPLSAAWNARAARIAKLRADIARGNQLRLRERSLRERWTNMQNRSLTNNASAAEQQVFRAVDRWAQETGVGIAAVTPQWKHDADEFSTYQCRIDASGDLGRLSQFLYRVEREPMALKLEAVELGARDKEGQQISLGLQISALVLNPPAK